MNDILDCFNKLIQIADTFIPEQAFIICVPFLAFASYLRIFRSNS